jgi:hypothetical protein
LLRALCGQLIEAREARRIERRIIHATMPTRPLPCGADRRGAGRAGAAIRPACCTRGGGARSPLPVARPRAPADVSGDAAAARLLRERGLGPGRSASSPWRARAHGSRARRRSRTRQAARGHARRRVEGWETEELLAPYGEWAESPPSTS